MPVNAGSDSATVTERTAIMPKDLETIGSLTVFQTVIELPVGSSTTSQDSREALLALSSTLHVASRDEVS